MVVHPEYQRQVTCAPHLACQRHIEYMYATAAVALTGNTAAASSTKPDFVYHHAVRYMDT
jgi:hypothetical protein